MASIARGLGLSVEDSSITAKVGLGPMGDRRYALTVELAVDTPSITDPAVAEEVVAQAHRICPYSNAIKGNVAVVLSITPVRA